MGVVDSCDLTYHPIMLKFAKCLIKQITWELGVFFFIYLFIIWYLEKKNLTLNIFIRNNDLSIELHNFYLWELSQNKTHNNNHIF